MKPQMKLNKIYQLGSLHAGFHLDRKKRCHAEMIYGRVSFHLVQLLFP